MSDDNSKLDLTRRKALAGLGGIGAGAALGGTGTMAFLNDSEETSGVMTAGELDLIVEYYSYWNQGSADEDYVSGEIDGDTVTGELTDVKPGDSGLVALCPRIETNPAYLWLCGELTSNDENGINDPESEVDETGGDGNGELAQNVDVTVQYCDIADDIGDSFDEEDVESSTDVWSGTLAELLDYIQYGVPLDGEGDTPGDDGGFFEPGDQKPYPGTEGENGEGSCLCLDWEVPYEVGNVIQSDSLSFDLQFYAQQSRHNNGTDNPCAPESTVSTGDGFSDISFEKALNMQALARGGSGRGEIQVHSDSGGVEDTNVFGSGTYPDDTDVPFTAEIDPAAETASLTVHGVTVTDDDVTDGDANGASTGDPEWPSGVPSYIDVAINASSASGNGVTTTVKDVDINGSSVSPSISESGGKEYLAVTNVDASSTVTVEGTMRFEGDQGDYTTQDWVGIDFR